jgi:hypothetical protein
MKDHVPLCLAIIDALLLLERSSPEEIEPDIAVRGMENISSSLLLLDEDDQRSLRLDFQRIADEAEDDSYAAFARSVPGMVGLAT